MHPDVLKRLPSPCASSPASTAPPAPPRPTGRCNRLKSDSRKPTTLRAHGSVQWRDLSNSLPGLAKALGQYMGLHARVALHWKGDGAGRPARQPPAGWPDSQSMVAAKGQGNRISHLVHSSVGAVARAGSRPAGVPSLARQEPGMQLLTTDGERRLGDSSKVYSAQNLPEIALQNQAPPRLLLEQSPASSFQSSARQMAMRKLQCMCWNLQVGLSFRLGGRILPVLLPSGYWTVEAKIACDSACCS